MVFFVFDEGVLLFCDEGFFLNVFFLNEFFFQRGCFFFRRGCFFLLLTRVCFSPDDAGVFLFLTRVFCCFLTQVFFFERVFFFLNEVFFSARVFFFFDEGVFLLTRMFFF